MPDWMNTPYLGNPLSAYLWAIGYFAAGLALLALLRHWILARLRKVAERTESQVDDFLIGSLEKTLVPLLYFGVFYLATQNLSLSPAAQKVLSTLGVVILTFMVVRFLSAVLEFLLREVWMKKEGKETRERNLRILFPVLRVVLWGLALVFLLDNLGFQISAVIAGLGIGGIAVAMASQAILGDLFSYVAILLDKPFEIGDFIILDGGFMGTIEYIGIKTTRVRSLTGEQIVIPNSDLTSHRVRNFKRMQERRMTFRLGVTYETSPEKVERAVAIVRELIRKHAGVRFERAHFASFGPSSLDLEAVYWVLSADYNMAMDIQQDLNLEIQRSFAREGIEFAFPTQTIHLHRGGMNEPSGSG